MLLSELELQMQRLRTCRAFVCDIEGLLPMDKQRHLQRGMDLLNDVINRLDREYSYMSGQYSTAEQTDPQEPSK